MDRKVELKVISITNSQAQIGAFALLLGEVEGNRQLPLIIGPAEAQSISLIINGVKTPRPLTHDLFAISLSALGVSLIRVLIYKAKDGIFYSYIYLKKDNELTRIDARTSDAIALAVRVGCPILILESILERECLHLSEDGTPRKQPTEDERDRQEMEYDPSEGATTITLEDELEEAIRDENYELAARIRDQIKQRDNK